MTYKEWEQALNNDTPPTGTYSDVIEMYANWDDDRTALLTRIKGLEEALKPFADKDECDDGFIIDKQYEHCERCEECQRVLKAREALHNA